VIKDGRFGPYVTDGETNASLRRGDDVETVTLQRAVELLAERRAAAPSTPRRRAGGTGRGGRGSGSSGNRRTGSGRGQPSAAATG